MTQKDVEQSTLARCNSNEQDVYFSKAYSEHSQRKRSDMLAAPRTVSMHKAVYVECSTSYITHGPKIAGSETGFES